MLLPEETQLKDADIIKAQAKSKGWRTLFSPLPDDADYQGGTAILVRKNLNCKLRKVELDAQLAKAKRAGRITIGELVFPTTGIHTAGTLRVGAVYAPARPNERRVFFEETTDSLNLLAKTGHLLLGGDHNEDPSTAWPNLDLQDTAKRIVSKDEDGNLSSPTPDATCHVRSVGTSKASHNRLDYFFANSGVLDWTADQQVIEVPQIRRHDASKLDLLWRGPVEQWRRRPVKALPDEALQSLDDQTESELLLIYNREKLDRRPG